MRFLFPLALLAVPAAAQTPGKPDPRLVVAGTYKVDPNHTQVTWSVNHMGFSCWRVSSGHRADRSPSIPRARPRRGST